MTWRRFTVPNAFLPMFFWLGLIVALVFLANGFIARAYDLSPWPNWLWIPACWAPFGLLFWLHRSGRVAFLDTDRIEGRQISRVPYRYRAAIVFLLYGLYAIARHYSDSIFAFDQAHAARLLGRSFSPLELAAWMSFFAGAAGAAWQTAFVVRAGRIERGTPAAPDRRAQKP